MTLPFATALQFAVVTCEDWEGNEYLRGVRPGYTLALRGKYKEGFDHNGPHVHMCECGQLTYKEGRIYPVDIQRHYGEVHGYVPALLP